MDSIRPYIKFFLCLALLLFIISPAAVSAAPKDKADDSEQGNSEEYSDRVQELAEFLEETGSDFSYLRGDRTDPFSPFISQRPTEKKKKEIDKDKLKGLRKFEPGQLSLVAIVESGKGEAKAMVQNAAGKGFVIRPGTKIGRYGVVDSISSNMVKVKETYEMTSGETQTEIKEMLLNKEEEE
ncbi:MAG: pilus assembly protein PilP [Desulfurivibrionaceae bacterium]